MTTLRKLKEKVELLVQKCTILHEESIKLVSETMNTNTPIYIVEVKKSYQKKLKAIYAKEKKANKAWYDAKQDYESACKKLIEKHMDEEIE